MRICYFRGVKGVAVLLLAIYLPVFGAASNAEWTLVRSPHFEIYSETGERDGRAAMLWLEQLRAFFVGAAGVPLAGDVKGQSQGPVRLIGFESAKEYAAFRPQPSADAYFLGGETGDYIVMQRLGSDEFRVAAHEYAHLVLHSLGLRVPPWLAEGIAEFFSTVRVEEQRCEVGGDLPMRSQVLRRRPWMPLAQLLAVRTTSQLEANRSQADIFYAESWALTDMLLLSPAYAGRFGELLHAAASGDFDSGTITGVYGKPVSAIMTDLRTWAEKSKPAVSLPGIAAVPEQVQVSQLTKFESDRMLADLLFACGEMDRADEAYKKLANERPDDARVAAALGSIALRKGDRSGAREQWKRAMRLGIRDASLCYRYAVLADELGLPSSEIGAALRRAIELKPDYDDARYKLGLLDSNAGDYRAALEQFRAMRSVAAGREFGYWIAMASALTETEQRDEAKKAAAKAMSYATSAEERAFASRLAYVADTDLTVQLSEDANGNLQMVTARKPHGSSDWNPFIEPGDQIRYLSGQIKKVECVSGKLSGFRVEGASGSVEVAVPDPGRVLIGGGAAEFLCGAEDGRKVAVQYAAFEKHGAADGVLRGMQFR